MPTDAELDAAATELRGTLEVMLSHADDKQAQTTGAAPSKTLWRSTTEHARCDVCGKAIPGVVAADRVAHLRCVDYEALKERWA